MSESSESSCEWIVLDETDTELSTGNAEYSPNLELDYNSLNYAISDSIRSSLSSEELEWQYENFDAYIPPYKSSIHVEDLDLKEADEECTEDLYANEIEADNISKCGFFNEVEDLCMETLPKTCCYKHLRNDRLNAILSILLILVVSSTIGLGIGHFLGWSHKCNTKNIVVQNELKKAATIGNPLDASKIKQNIEDAVGELEKEVVNLLLPSENLSDSASCSNSEENSISTHWENLKIQSDDNIVKDVQLSEKFATNGLELKNQENNHTDRDHFQVSDVISHPNWHEISHNEISFKNKLSGSEEVTPVKINDNLVLKVKNAEFGLPSELYIEDKSSLKEIKDFFASEKIPSVNLGSQAYEDEIHTGEFKLFTQFHFKHKNLQKEVNLTNQLRGDLNEVIQSLSSIVLIRLTDDTEKYDIEIENSKMVFKMYMDFQNLINKRITEIDNFILSTESKTLPKYSLKNLQKMVYCVVDSIDHLLKVTFKTLSKEGRKINAYKFSSNISKVIFNFNKKWDKNKKFWIENVQKINFQEFKEKPLKKEKRQWKTKTFFGETNHKNDKFKRYSMKF